LLLCSSLALAQAQGKISIEINMGQDKARLAVGEFRPANAEPQTSPLKAVFDQTLWDDRDNAGIFNMGAKNFNPANSLGQPREVRIGEGENPPENAGLLGFGNVGVSSDKIDVQGWLFDVKNAGTPPNLGKQYREDANADNARLIAHRFADEIIARIGGGIPGVAESKIVFISTRSGHKEVWTMDYDGQGQKQLTHLGSLALSPRISPDRTRL